MERLNKKILLIAGCMIIAILLIFLGRSIIQTKSPSVSQDVEAKQATAQLAYLMAGKVDAVESADVSTKASGKIAELNVDVGSVVTKGQVLGRIDMQEVPAQMSQAQSTIDMANINLTNAQSGYNRTQELYQSDMVSKEAMESAQKQLDTAQAQLKQAQASLALINATSSNGVIVAPVSGTVTAKKINPGEMASSGATLMTIVNPDKTYISAYLPARLSDKVQQGQKVTIRISELPDKLFAGQVSLVDSVVDAQNKNILVKVNMLENDAAVKVGMFAEIALDE
ncbi:efflux RND transporter periplasmic adaptor subunit [Aminipila butyrica]|uniref:Efflux RND transporter periplasmic adaptor subunit n=1 Tax=Aminipila butyrica TaxID=433296 RepID=A0A858BYF8_9FIRM|nr:efflux RND transporter periplasmic adaptor subunit [Aminipila butyrica]QIB70165.1 efflux RND transporter periplasmic adaptor subunit [Aminipila butyrica]